MYIFLKSDDSISYHPDNNTCEFVSELPKSIKIEGIWNCSLIHFDVGEEKTEDILVCCDLVESSSVYGREVPILNVLNNAGDIIHPYYIPVNKDIISRIRIKLLTSEGKKLEPEPRHCKLVIHLRPNHNT